MPLIVTSGHGGWDMPVQRRMTHRFTPVDLSGPISVANFSTPVEDSNPDQPEIIPWMPERKETKGSNLVRDVNTDSAALNVAGGVACIINQDLSGHNLSASSVPPQCAFAEVDDYDVLPLMTSPSAKKPSALKTPSQGPSSQDNPSFYYPHVVIFRIPRKFVDVNRNDTGENAFADHPVAKAAWNEYHDLIEHVQKIVSQGYDKLKDPKKPKEPSEGCGLLLDIHGHSHAANLIEVGYLLNGTTLALDDTQLDAHAHVLTNLTSVRSLENIIQQDPNPSDRENRDPSKITFSDFLRGQDDSLGGMLQAQGLDALPSPRHPAPARGASYFYGGYTTRRHGSRDRKEEGAMDAIQLEMPKTLRFVEKEQAREIGMRIGQAVEEFMARYYNFPPRGSRCVGHARSDERERGLEHSDEVRMAKSIKDICTMRGSDDQGVETKVAKTSLVRQPIKRQTSRLQGRKKR
ncbi:hypothetical protein CPC16_007580 [Podila verticillata]|nr:hypothetical protein CPC16_007580 [Podila verticillata]